MDVVRNERNIREKFLKIRMKSCGFSGQENHNASTSNNITLIVDFDLLVIVNDVFW